MQACAGCPSGSDWACAAVLLLAVTACESAAPDSSAGVPTSTATAPEPAVERLCPAADLDTVRVLDCLNATLLSFWTQRGVDVGAQAFVYYAIPSSMPTQGCARLLGLSSWFRCIDDDVVYLSGGMLERDRDVFGVDIGLAMAFVPSTEALPPGGPSGAALADGIGARIAS